MPLRADPPRPPDGVGRQAIRTTRPTAQDRRSQPPRDRLSVFQRRALAVLVVADAVTWTPVVVGLLVGAQPVVDGRMVAASAVAAVAVVCFLVARWSGRQ